MVHAPAEPLDLGIVLASCSLEPTGYTEQERPDGLILLPYYETMGLQIGLAGCDRFLIPFEANARHIGNVKQSVTNFIWLL
jgi:hypothetical protein